MIELLDFVQAQRLPKAAIRVRIALDLVECEGESSPSPSAARVTVAAVRIDERGQAHAPGCATHQHLATLLWEVMAGRVADTDELPWSDPADDLPPGVLDTFASLQLRPAKDSAELCRRFAAGIRSHASSHEEVLRGLAAPAANPITLRAPAVQIEALRTLSAVDPAEPPTSPTEDLIPTRVLPIVALPVVATVERRPAQVDELPRSTLDPWNAPLPGGDVSRTPQAVTVEHEPPRRRTWPVVAACLVAALLLIGLAGRERIATATAAATEATEATATPVATSPARAEQSAMQGPSTPQAVQSAAASQTVAPPLAKTATPPVIPRPEAPTAGRTWPRAAALPQPTALPAAASTPEPEAAAVPTPATDPLTEPPPAEPPPAQQPAAEPPHASTDPAPIE